MATDTPGLDEETTASTEQDRRIVIDPDDLHGSFARALEAHPDFKQAASTVIGTRKQREADARIKELEARLESMTLDQKRRKFESMDADERAEALRDPTVATEYAEVMGKRSPDPTAVRQTQDIELAVEDALDELRAIGAPDSRINAWKAYLRDPEAPFDRRSAAGFIRSVQRAVDIEVHTPADQRFEKYGYGKAPVAAPQDEASENEQPEPPVRVNPRLARGAPDTSRPDGGGKKRRYSTYAEAARIREEEGAGAMPLSELKWARRNLPFQ